MIGLKSNKNMLAKTLRGTSALSFAVAVGSILSASGSAALPTSANVTGTQGAPVHVTTTGTTTTVTQNGTRAVINWNNFNTNAGETVNFVAPTTTAVTLNRISGGQTTFSGNLNANASVWFINPNGFLFNNTSHVNVGSLLLSTADISAANTQTFLNSPTNPHYVFDQPGNAGAKIVINGASITTTANPGANLNLGDIIIQAPAVVINGNSTLTANGGNIVVAAGSTFTADFSGDGLITWEPSNANSSNNGYTITSPSTVGVGTNGTYAIEIDGGSILTAGKNTSPGGGTVLITAQAQQNAVLDHVINLGGQFYDNDVDTSGNPVNQNASPNGSYANNSSVTITAASAKSALPDIYAVGPTPAPAPSPSPSPTPIPSLQTDSLFFAPLTRPLVSQGDQTVLDTTVDPNISNVSYTRPYLVSLQTSVADGKLTLLAPGVTGSTGGNTNLGGLSPAAGGDLSQLSPAAGGSNAGGNSTTRCANSFLDGGWSKPANELCE